MQPCWLEVVKSYSCTYRGQQCQRRSKNSQNPQPTCREPVSPKEHKVTKKVDSACPWLVPPTGIGRRSPLWEIGGRWSMWEEALKASDYLLVLPITTSPPTSQNPKLWSTCVWNGHKFPPAETCLVLTSPLEIPIPWKVPISSDYLR